MPADAATYSPASGPLRGLASFVILAWGWPRRLIAVAAGAIGALAMAPFGFLPALFVSMMVALWLIDGSSIEGANARAGRASLGAAFRAGWWWGFGYFLAGLWWLGSAFLVDADKFAWLLPLGVFGLPAGLAFFPALGFACARAIWPAGAARPLALAVGLGLSEWLRAVILTGFPWNEYGMALGQHLWLAEAASLFGLHGLTLIAICVAAAPATLWDRGAGAGRFAPTVMAAAALAALAGFALYQLAAPTPEPVAGVKLRLLQPNIAQGPDFAPENGAKILGQYLALSDRATSPERAGIADVTHLIWPESAFPFILSRDAGSLARIAQFLGAGAKLVTGAARLEETKGGRQRYFNSIEILDRTGLLSERYDKRHLVPFGEYMPLQSWLERLGITQFVQFPGGFERGAGANVLHVPGLPDAIAMICYEAIFPNERGGAREGAHKSAAWLLNVTDDAWFGLTPGPYQHYAQARLRAIELGLPLVRVANNGITAVVDARGRVLEVTPLGAETIVDTILPGALTPTPQARWGSATAAAIWLAMLAATRIGRRRRPR